MTATEAGEPRTDRDAIFAMVRDHLTAELEVSTRARSSDATRFRDDLDADSLDLYELVMELEDTYGIAMSEDEAAKHRDRGAAVDFVFERLPGV